MIPSGQGAGDEVLEEFCKLADACIADKDVESSSQAVNDLFDQNLACFWDRNVSCDGNESRAVLR